MYRIPGAQKTILSLNNESRTLQQWEQHTQKDMPAPKGAKALHNFRQDRGAQSSEREFIFESRKVVRTWPQYPCDFSNLEKRPKRRMVP